MMDSKPTTDSLHLFVIPTWYPSLEKPLNGISIQEQTKLFAQFYPQSIIAISLWGQREESHLLWAKDHIKNLKKIIRFFFYKKSQREVLPNLFEYYTPALTWTKKIFSGNIRGMIRANERNFLEFKKRAGKIDVIHAHVCYSGGYIAMHLSKKYKIPYIITERMGPFPLKDFMKKDGSLKKIILDPLKKANQVVAISWALSERIKSFGITNVEVVPNFIDENFFVPPSPDKPKRNSFSFFFLGLLSKEKGLYDLVDAIALIESVNIPVEFWIAGYGDPISFMKYSKKLKIADQIQIKWLGKLTREQARNTMQQCDVFVLPSHHESFGTVYIEALACGKPIIAANNGGALDIVCELNGFFVPIQDSQTLSEGIFYMIKNHQAFFSREIRRDFEEKFSASAIVPLLMNMYQEVINQHG